MVISHNPPAMNSNRQLGMTTSKIAKSQEKLSSGYKINRAADDAAGLSISEKMRKQIRGLDRGVRNTMDGISLCQVGDGALAEVTDLIHRLEELSVQAANGTNSETDRRSIQDEVDQIIKEVDRIGDTTKFNEVFLFRGQKSDGVRMVVTEAAQGDIPFSDFKLGDMRLGSSPFGPNSAPNVLGLSAFVDNEASPFNGKNYNLIYGSGSTSESSYQITFQNDDKKVVKLKNQKTVENYTEDVANNSVSRDIVYEDADNGYKVRVTQTIKAVQGEDEKYYEISYRIADESTNTTNPIKDVDFMFHVDTAYNDDDICEGYYTDGERLTKTTVFLKDSSSLSHIIGSQTSPYLKTGIPDSLSIIDVDSALAFSEKITFGSNKPDAFSLGYYHEIDDWNYYSSLSSHLGQNAIKQDLGFSAIYSRDLSSGPVEISFKYGIAEATADKNLKGTTIYKKEAVVEHVRVSNPKNIWIQSGADALDGIILQSREMNANILGIDDFNVLTMELATDSINKVEKALKYINALRSLFGAQQNRLEHTVKNESNVVENTQAAESRIRDTDMADEMVRFSMNNILQQAGQSMLAQANQTPNGVMSLLQS